MHENELISVDWGTTSLRVRLVEAETRKVIAAIESANGVAQIGGDDRVVKLEAILREKVLHVLAEGRRDGCKPQVVISGMAGSTLGLRNLPYASLPWALDGSSARSEQITVAGLEGFSIRLFSGVAAARDVMRGEETELMGLANLVDFGRAALVVLPGTHSKHITVRNGKMVDFSTFLTGELFWLLAKNGTLASAVDTDALTLDEPMIRGAFIEGVRSAAKEVPLTMAMFQIRASAVLQQRPGGEGAGELLGLLIGAELNTSQKSNDDQKIWIAAGSWWENFYRIGAQTLSIGCEFIPADALKSALIEAHCTLALASPG